MDKDKLPYVLYFKMFCMTPTTPEQLRVAYDVVITWIRAPSCGSVSPSWSATWGNEDLNFFFLNKKGSIVIMFFLSSVHTINLLCIDQEDVRNLDMNTALF